MIIAVLSLAVAAYADDSLRSAYEQARLRAERSGSGFRLANDENRIEAQFTSGGMNARHPEGAFGLHLEAYGYGERLSAPLPAVLHANGPLVELRRGALVEWYVNDKRGLEQGFTLREAPGEARAGEPLVVELGVTGELTPVLAAGAVLLERDGAAVLRYDGLRAWDATGRELTARMEVRGRRVRLVVDDGGAAYPVVIDPWIQLQKLTASDGARQDSFGGSVSVSGDTAVIGAYGNANFQGAAYVFVRSGSTWTQQQKLTASDGAAGDSFGTSVSVSGDTTVIGASAKAGFQGAAYVFVRNGTTWSQQQKLTASDGAGGDSFGISVSVIGDTAVLGAQGNASNKGAAYVFARNGSTWSQQQKLTASDGATPDQFGVSVSVSGDTTVIGAYLKANSQGAAYVFVRNGSTWSQQQKLTASDGTADDRFGASVSVSGDTAVIGAYGKAAYQGAAYVFARNGSTWSQQQKLTASEDATPDQFGASVSVSGDTTVIGAWVKASLQGAVYVFVRSGSTWSQQQKLTASDGASGDRFGFSVSVSGDALVIGASGKASLQGAAYSFTPNDGSIPFGSSWKYLVTPRSSFC